MNTDIKPGDIIGFTGANPVSDMINLGTYGIPRVSCSHVGIIGEYNGEQLLFESTTLDDTPCVIQGKCVAGTQAQRLADRLASYQGRVWHYPITRPLYDHERSRMNQFLLDHIGISYDKLGAFRSNDHLSLIESFFHEENLHSIFCSEWCAATHNHIGLFSTSNASRWSPNRFLRAERFYGTLYRRTSLK